ncbi:MULTISPECIES: FAD-dependent monooxygenase [Corallococcus]|uniref:FAD-dependent monooxygenase n=1 Tax=Corallococcus TaxID=83461 RepID=UPI000EC04634|nr:MULTISPECIES: FAD-dependent monooxygenase [Corallococcus]NPD22701.1 NAD(P)-binding protein [Corallococcus exiguus]RKH96034.1 NADH:flavin oxidoreductase [Corallococcus sp. AB038B]
MKPPRIVIVGGGPAGMVLAYQLVTNGVPVRVLERHPDFEREFRGELLQAPVVEALKRAGLFSALLERGQALPDIERVMYVGERRTVRVPGPREQGAVVSQPGMLALLHEQCLRHPHYRMDFGTTVLDAVQEEGRVVALRTRRDGVEERVDGDLFIVCNGRNSHLRKSCGLETEQFETTADALWLRFDLADAPEALPTSLQVHMFGKGRVVVFQPSTRHRLHVAFSEPGDLNGLRKDLPELRRRLLPTVPETLRPHVERKLDEHTEWQVLRILVDRVKRWHAPGVLFLGDAAHTMSPSGGQGLNLAIKDTFVAANHLLDAIREDRPLDAAVFDKIQSERQPEVDQVQAGQTRAGQMVLKQLGVLHVMFTILGAVMAVAGKKMQGTAGPVTEPRYFTPLARGTAMGPE